MESKKAKKYLDHQYNSEKGRSDNLVIDDYTQYALHAVDLAEQEMKDKAINCYKLSCNSYKNGICDQTFWECDTSDEEIKCNEDCKNMKKFKKLINKP
jgi:hypothetical protein